MDVILAVDYDPQFLLMVSRILSNSGYQVISATDEKSMHHQLKVGHPDLILLDWVLEKENGIELAMQVRKSSEVPIIILTGKKTENDMVAALELVADDYITKPFRSAVLLARIKAMLRRSRELPHDRDSSKRQIAFFEGWKCNMISRQLFSSDGKEVGLTSGEFSLLCIFINHPNRVLARGQLLELMGQEDTFDRSVDTQILRLRKKIENVGKKRRLIKTVRSVGYIFASDVKWNKPLPKFD